MTTIAYRNGVMASDTLVSDEGYLQKTFRPKIKEIRGCLVGCAGGAWAGNVFFEWFEGNKEDDCFANELSGDDDFTALVVDANKEVFIYNRYLSPDDVSDMDNVAIGSGSKIAMALMDFGATAEEAVKVTIDHDLYSGGKIQTIKVK